MKEKTGVEIPRETIDKATQEFIKKGGKIKKYYDIVADDDKKKMDKIIDDCTSFLYPRSKINKKIYTDDLE